MFAQASTAQKPPIGRNTPFKPFKDLTMNSSNAAGDRTLPSQDGELDIPVVAEVVGASKTGYKSLNHPPSPPVEVFTTMASNVSEWLVAETLTKASTRSSVGVEKRYSKRGGSAACISE